MSLTVKFTKKEYSFIEDNFGFSKEDVDGFSEDELYDLQDRCADIEIEAAKKDEGDDLSADEKTATDIVTKIGNTLCGDDDDDE